MTRDALFSPFEIVEGDRGKGMVLIADHAGRELPDEYGDLGLPAEEFERHIAYDIGVEAVTRQLAAVLGVPAVMARFSRLLIDANRGEDDPTLIRQLYDGTVIRANYPMAEAERERRLERYWRPYHDALGAMVSSRRGGERGGAVPVLRPFLHADDAGAGAALARQRAVGFGRPRRRAAARHAGGRPGAGGGRQRAL